MKARVLLADDHPRFPEMEARLLEPEFEVVGKVGNGQALIEEAMRLKPDIIITDISMPILDGIEAVRTFKEVWLCVSHCFLECSQRHRFCDQVPLHGGSRVCVEIQNCH